MTRDKNSPMVITLKDKCRVCYTCVRECPAKAIRIADGQAEIITSRCIGCGNCVRVCSQKAKKVLSTIKDVQELLAEKEPIAAIIAPSFPAEFSDYDYQTLVGMVRALGFTYVNEVAFGADLVAFKVREILVKNPDKRYISTACPAVFGYIKRYNPELINMLINVVSPMVATARMLRSLHNPKLRIVFIGPCIAKMGEANSDEMIGEIDEVLTFEELHRLFSEVGIKPEKVKPSDFDPPHAAKGSLFPIQRGLLETAEIHEDLISGDVISASGRSNFVNAMIEFASGELDARFLDVLCCDGCIMGAGMTTVDPPFKRRARVSQYAAQSLKKRDQQSWQTYFDRFSKLDLSRDFVPYSQRLPYPDEKDIKANLARMGKFKPEDELNCGACGYETCREHAVAIIKGLAEPEMCLPYTIEVLHKTIRELNLSHAQCEDIRSALMQSEKMASMGQLAAGIAHEVNNPLGVVLMYAHLLAEDCPADSSMHEDLNMIAEQADRCKKIVSGLLNFARQNKVSYKMIDLNDLIDNFTTMVELPQNVQIRLAHGLLDPLAEIDADQIVQVLINLVNNSITAMPNGGIITIKTTGIDDMVGISVSDTGTGIPKEYLSKIFEPFFTTKKVGQGTGLGLSIIYGIIKMHSGDIRVESNTDPAIGPTGTTFNITLPRIRKKITNPVA